MKYFVKDPPRINSELMCQNDIALTTDKLGNQKILKLGYQLLNEGSYVLDGGMISSLESDSSFSQKLNINQINNIFLNIIDIKSTKEKSKFLKIKYELIENEDDSVDKVGSLLTSFRVNNKEVFSMFIGFLTYDMTEIEKRVQCSLEAFKYNAKP